MLCLQREIRSMLLLDSDIQHPIRYAELFDLVTICDDRSLLIMMFVDL